MVAHMHYNFHEKFATYLRPMCSVIQICLYPRIYSHWEVERVFEGEGEGLGGGGGGGGGEKLFSAANERAEETPTNYDVGPSVGNPQPNIYSLYMARARDQEGRTRGNIVFC
jgi:hypothetical protein